jgi:ParB/RepB/Spo0J family partition protein
MNQSHALEFVTERDIPLDAIVTGETNPRVRFDEAELVELAASIKEYGLLQPVVVAPLPGEDERYELIAGERRLRACRMAGQHLIPARVVVGDAATLRGAQLEENTRRVPLNPLEEARGFARYQQDFPCPPAALARRLRLSPDYVRGRLKLLELPQAAQEAVAAGQLALGSAWELLRIEGEQARCALAETIVRDRLSVGQTVQLVRGERARQLQQARQARQAEGCEQYARELRRRHPVVLTMADYDPSQHRRSVLLNFTACATCPRKARLVLAPGRTDEVCFDPACFKEQAERPYRDLHRRHEESRQRRREALAAVLRTEYVQQEHMQLLMWAMLQALGSSVDSWRAEKHLPAYTGSSNQEWDMLSSWPYERLTTETVRLCVGSIAIRPNHMLPQGLRRCLTATFGVDPARMDDPGSEPWIVPEATGDPSA